MLYSASIETPANTLEADAIFTEIKVTDGVIHEIGVQFPAGCAGLNYCQIFDGAHPLIPSTEGQFLRGDDILINSKEYYEITDAPRIITVKTWNLDDTYNHTIEVYIKQLPRFAIQPVGAAEGIIASLKSMFQRRG